MSQTTLVLDGDTLHLHDVESVARHSLKVRIGELAQSKLQSAHAVVQSVMSSGEETEAGSSQAIYGVNTGFGSLSRVRISRDEIRAVQRNLVRSHAAGVGQPLDEEVVRAMLLILAASLCRGHSGVRLEVVNCIVELLNHRITPIVPSRGSVGASGDLAPLAHAALVLIGEGEALCNGRPMLGAEALRTAKITPITLEAKEGLALINGTHLMTAIGSLALYDVERLCDAAISSAAMAIDACRATDSFLDHRLHAARNQPGQVQIAQRLRQLLAGSEIVNAHKDNDPRVQDPYCLRATPQVLGAAFDAIEYVKVVFENELGAVTDNPLVFADEGQAGSGPSSRWSSDPALREPGSVKSNIQNSGSKIASIVSGGNFHGMPLAIALDTLKIALCHISGIAERRIYWLLAASDSENPINVYLSPQPGLHSGMMIVQYTAAACCNELQTLAHPASVHNIPTSAGVEDYNSMGATSALHARSAVDLAINVIAAELLVMTEAMEYQRPLRSGEGVERTYRIVRQTVPRLTEDRPPAPDIANIAKIIRSGEIDIHK